MKSTIECDNCFCQFDPVEQPMAQGLNVASGASGALLGARIGMIAGPLGAVSGAVIGGLLAHEHTPKLTRCPCCDRVLKY